jgi:hypothetical protein
LFRIAEECFRKADEVLTRGHRQVGRAHAA